MSGKSATSEIELTESAVEADPVCRAPSNRPETARPTGGNAAEGDGGEHSQRMDGIVIGRLAGYDGPSGVLVDYPGNPTGTPLSALSTVAVNDQDCGREVALAFQGGDPRKPVLIGFLQHLRHEPSSAEEPEARSVEVARDGDRLTLTAEREIVLRCGKASITLTRAGKVLIRGAYVVSRSSGVNRIQGGSVQLN